MGWQTDVITQLVFNRKTYNSPYDILNDKRANEEKIHEITEELSIMATSRPEDLLLHNEDMDLFSLHRQVKDKLEVLEECIIDNYKLECLKENFNLRHGDFIKNPNRKEAVKKWLIDNYILEEKDFSNNNTVDTQVNNIEPIDINVIEGD